MAKRFQFNVLMCFFFVTLVLSPSPGQGQDVLSSSQWITAFYASYWNRAPDPEGHAYWLGMFNQGRLTIPEIAENFAISDEAKAAYPYFNAPHTASDSQINDFVRSVYRNLLDREVSASDEGLVYWVGELRSGKTIPGAVIGNIIHAAMQAGLDDWQTILAKVRPVGCSFFPTSNIWNRTIHDAPVDSNSDAYVGAIGADVRLHMDFGSGVWPPGSDIPMGIPYVVVDGSQPKVPVSFYYPDESDAGPYPIPPDAPIEGGPNGTGDRHVLVLDEDNCLLYEVFDAHPEDGGVRWSAGSGAIFDLTSNALRPDGWTSADAAGLPILPGLVRYAEVASGEIRHALRFTAPQTRRAYVWPARHYASSLTGVEFPPMGQRFRLRADYDISGFSAHARTIAKALQTYGMILADNGSAWFVSGAPDERWDNSMLRELKALRGSDFEAVDVSGLMLDPDSGRTRQ